MFDYKISGIATGAAFIISLLLGLLSGAAFSAVLLRAILFAMIFFVLGSIAYFLITRFLPELLDIELGAGRNLSGSMVNIALGDEEETDQPPEMSRAEEQEPAYAGEDGDELEDISRLMDSGSGEWGMENEGTEQVFGMVENTGTLEESPMPSNPGLDQQGQSGYTEKGLEDENPFGELLSPFSETAVPRKAPEPAGRVSTGSSGLDVDGGGEALPDLDALAGDFNSSVAVIAAESMESGSPVRRPLSARGKPVKMEGDFNPKDIAAAISDRLKREEG